MYVSVIPLEHSFDDEPLLYEVPNELQESCIIGAIVSIPWRKSSQNALIYSLHKTIDVDYEVRTIYGVFTEAILPQTTLDRIVTISQTYIYPLNAIARLFLPKNTEKYYLKNPTTQHNFDDKNRQKIDASKLVIISNIQDFFASHSPQSNGVYIFPDLFSAKQYMDTFWEDNVLFFDTQKTPKKYFEQTIALSKTDTKYIFGDRKLLLLPIDTFEHIYYFEEQLSSSIFFGRKKLPCTVFLNTITTSTITQVDISPTLEAFYRHAQAKTLFYE